MLTKGQATALADLGWHFDQVSVRRPAEIEEIIAYGLRPPPESR